MRVRSGLGRVIAVLLGLVLGSHVIAADVTTTNASLLNKHVLLSQPVITRVFPSKLKTNSLGVFTNFRLSIFGYEEIKDLIDEVLFNDKPAFLSSITPVLEVTIHLSAHSFDHGERNVNVTLLAADKSVLVQLVNGVTVETAGPYEVVLLSNSNVAFFDDGMSPALRFSLTGAPDIIPSVSALDAEDTPSRTSVASYLRHDELETVIERVCDHSCSGHVVTLILDYTEASPEFGVLVVEIQLVRRPRYTEAHFPNANFTDTPCAPFSLVLSEPDLNCRISLASVGFETRQLAVDRTGTTVTGCFKCVSCLPGTAVVNFVVAGTDGRVNVPASAVFSVLDTPRAEISAVYPSHLVRSSLAAFQTFRISVRHMHLIRDQIDSVTFGGFAGATQLLWPDIIVTFTVPEELVRLRPTIDVQILDAAGVVLLELRDAIEVVMPPASATPITVLEAPRLVHFDLGQAPVMKVRLNARVEEDSRSFSIDEGPISFSIAFVSVERSGFEGFEYALTVAERCSWDCDNTKAVVVFSLDTTLFRLDFLLVLRPVLRALMPLVFDFTAPAVGTKPALAEPASSLPVRQGACAPYRLMAAESSVPVTLAFPAGSGLFARDVAAVPGDANSFVGCVYCGGCHSGDVPLFLTTMLDEGVLTLPTSLRAHIVAGAPPDPTPEDSGALMVELDVFIMVLVAAIAATAAASGWYFYQRGRKADSFERAAASEVRLLNADSNNFHHMLP